MYQLLLTHDLRIQAVGILRRDIHQSLQAVFQDVLAVQDRADGVLVSGFDLRNIRAKDQISVHRRGKIVLQPYLCVLINCTDNVCINPLGILRHSLPRRDLDRGLRQIIQGILHGFPTAAANTHSCHGQPRCQPEYSLFLIQIALHSVNSLL